MNEVIKLNSKKYISLYEICDEENIAIWGGENASEALKWYRNSPPDSKIFVSEWLADEEDARVVSNPIEITPLVLATIADCMERWAK